MDLLHEVPLDASPPLEGVLESLSRGVDVLLLGLDAHGRLVQVVSEGRSEGQAEVPPERSNFVEDVERKVFVAKEEKSAVCFIQIKGH